MRTQDALAWFLESGWQSTSMRPSGSSKCSFMFSKVAGESLTGAPSVAIDGIFHAVAGSATGEHG